MGRTRALRDLDPDQLDGRRVLVRVDYNVPLTEEGEVSDSTRIDATLPTLRRLTEAGARVALVSHLGRPDGRRALAFSLRPVAKLLGERLGRHVELVEGRPASDETEAAVDALGPGDIVLLENIRFEAGETANEPELARALARLADVYVGEAFGVAHRAHASNVGCPERVRANGGAVVAGDLMERELHFLRDVMAEPTRPFVAVLGGAKISGKIDLIEAILPRVDRILVGGAMANTFFRALGLETGQSLVEEDRVPMARELLDLAGDRLLLPLDCVVADEISAAAHTRTIDRSEVSGGDRIGDIGPATRELFAAEIGEARTSLWNGPMGVFELDPFRQGSIAVAEAMAEATDRGAVTVVGGGDSAAAAADAGVTQRMSHISTGGGASLDLLAGRELPGVEVLDRVEKARE
ncbi:MAG: phosphoglycerate kinase [Gemmatimonadota bacterium]